MAKETFREQVERYIEEGVGDTKREFVDSMLEAGALAINTEEMFTLKSGRKSPFFFNAGEFQTGRQLRKLAAAYADTLWDKHIGVGTLNKELVIFGPAYKGIPLAVALCFELSEDWCVDNARYCSNRKEEKDHGEKSSLLGVTKLHDGDKVILIDDVVTSGGSVKESVEILRAQADVEILGLVVAVDRQEAAAEGGSETALEAIRYEFGFMADAAIKMAEVVACLAEAGKLSEKELDVFAKYYEQYGPRA